MLIRWSNGLSIIPTDRSIIKNYTDKWMVDYTDRYCKNAYHLDLANNKREVFSSLYDTNADSCHFF